MVRLSILLLIVFASRTNEKSILVNSDILHPEELFRHTSGRWLIDEKYQLEQRFVKFNVDRFCSQAASLFSSETNCVRISKLEGIITRPSFLL